LRADPLIGVFRASVRAIAAAALWLALAIGGLAYAQSSDITAVGSMGIGGRGGPAGEGGVRPAASQEGNGSGLEFSSRAGVASDYIYRGTTLSDRKPAVGAGIEATFRKFYVGATLASVDLPSNPAAEITLSAGARPKLGEVEFDFGWTYFLYPNETPLGPVSDTDYWEVVARAETKIGDRLRFAGGFAYSPNVSNTGAWSKYAAFGLGLELPRNTLPQNVTASLTGGAGYSWFGNQSEALGGFPLPPYVNWNAGITFTHKSINLDLRYYDTSLSKENCFVLTGDPNATPGGNINPVTNPEGLTSGWCSATLVAKVWLALN
jgi:uncharacterized protein (TIGR02001 family)